MNSHIFTLVDSYVHPTDPNWPGLKCHPFSQANLHTKTPAQAGVTNGHRAGAPLVPQTDLFRLECKIEYDDDAPSVLHHRVRDNKPHTVRECDPARSTKPDYTRKKPRSIESPYPNAPAKMKLDERRRLSNPVGTHLSQSFRHLMATRLMKRCQKEVAPALMSYICPPVPRAYRAR